MDQSCKARMAQLLRAAQVEISSSLQVKGELSVKLHAAVWRVAFGDRALFAALTEPPCVSALRVTIPRAEAP